MEGDRKTRRRAARRQHDRKNALRIIGGTLAGAMILPVVGPTEAEAGRIGNRIVRVGRRYIGVPYVKNGASLRRDGGWDCDAYVKRIMAKANVWVPWGPTEQASYGNPRSGYARPGDVVYFVNRSGYVYHVGIASGGGKLLHASTYYGKVVESYIGDIRGYGGAQTYR
jgi:cell wall-associated NlpC family hydrolase